MSELSTSETPVLDLLARMTADSVEASSLDAQTIILVRLAALVASDAPAVSYALNLAVAGELGLTVEDARSVHRGRTDSGNLPGGGRDRAHRGSGRCGHRGRGDEHRRRRRLNAGRDG